MGQMGEKKCALLSTIELLSDLLQVVHHITNDIEW